MILSIGLVRAGDDSCNNAQARSKRKTEQVEQGEDVVGDAADIDMVHEGVEQGGVRSHVSREAALDFAHFVNGTWITDLVFVNLSTEASRPAPTPFHTDILPSRPAIYFYDTEGNPIAAESVVDITGALTVQTEMEPLGVLTISTHGRGELVSGSARVVSDGPIGGMLRFEHPDLGVAGVGASPPLSDALFPVRRQEGVINTGVALHNLESSPGLVRCDLMR